VIREKCIEAIAYKIDLGGGDNILITQKWGVIKVSVTANGKDKFQDSMAGTSVGTYDFQ